MSNIKDYSATIAEMSKAGIANRPLYSEEIVVHSPVLLLCVIDPDQVVLLIWLDLANGKFYSKFVSDNYIGSTYEVEWRKVKQYLSETAEGARMELCIV